MIPGVRTASSVLSGDDVQVHNLGQHNGKSGTRRAAFYCLNRRMQEIYILFTFSYK
jgi:hypothetical protein